MAERYVLILTKDQWELVGCALEEYEPAGWIIDEVEHAPHGDTAALLDAAEWGDDAHKLCDFIKELRAHWEP